MLRWIVGTVVVVLAAAGFAVPVYAAERSFVSGNGTDTGTCERQAPCRTFGYAITQAPAGGEIVAVDSAGYGPVTINKSISLIGAPGVHAAIAPPSGDAITVNAGTVVLRHLYLSGVRGNQTGAIQNGVVYNSGSALVVEDCVATYFSNGTGIVRHVTSPDVAHLTVTDTVLRGNGTFALDVADLGTGVTDVEIDHSRAQLNSAGFTIEDGAHATITDSVASGNGGIGFSVFGGRLFMERDTATGNGTGIDAFGGLVVVSNSTIVDNTTGLRSLQAQLISRGNNTLFGNGTDGMFTSTIPAAFRPT